MKLRLNASRNDRLPGVNKCTNKCTISYKKGLKQDSRLEIDMMKPMPALPY